jgi:hypothetical protein
MAIVREEISPNPVSLGRAYPTIPPTKCRSRQAIYDRKQWKCLIRLYRK